MKSMLGWRQAIVLAIVGFAFSPGPVAAQTLIDPNSASAAEEPAAGTSDAPARRRSILRRNRQAESEPARAPATEAPAYRVEPATTPAAGTPARAPQATTAPVIAAPATPGQGGFQPYAEQPATYSATPGRPYLGITFDMRYPNAAVVKAVAPGGPAAQSGIRPGDAIHAINRGFISNWQDVVAMVQSLRPGDQLDISYSRRVEERTQVVLTGRDVEGAQTAAYGEPPAAPPAAAAPAPGPVPTPATRDAAGDVPPAAPAAAANAQTPATGEDAQSGRSGRDRSARPPRQRGGLFRRN